MFGSQLQHYVPRFLLNNFSVGESSQIFVFDKHEDRIFKTTTRNVAAEHGFYDLPEDSPGVLEQKLSDLEARAADIINAVLQAESLAAVSLADRSTLSLFCAVQFLRSKQQRLALEQMDVKLQEALRAKGIDPDNVGNYRPFKPGEAKYLSLNILQSAGTYAPHFHDKMWLLFKSTQGAFYISDNPVVLYNANDYSPRGNRGLAVRGIAIYLPLSKHLSLGMICRSYEDLFRTMRRKLMVFRLLRFLYPAEQRRIAFADKFMRAAKRGEPIESEPANVLHHNSLQVLHAARYVYSSSNDFSLVQEMVASDPSIRNGPQYDVV